MKLLRRVDTSDVAIASGLVLLGAGLAMVALPLAFVTVGTVVLGIGLAPVLAVLRGRPR